MAAQKKEKNHPRINLNLLHPQGVPEKLPIRFLRWLLSYGRYIVVVVEVVVLVSFAARFILDAEIADLKKQIDNELTYIKSESKTEADVRQTHLRLDSYKKGYTYDQTLRDYLPNPNWVNLLNKISAQIPSSVQLTGINFDSTTGKLEFKLAAKSSTNADVAAFLNGLKEEKAFTNVTLASISFDQGEITFSISGGVK